MKIKADTIARTIVLFLALVNQILAVAGKEVLPFAEDDIYQIVSLLATFISAVTAWWHNNSFTKAAIEADTYKDELKQMGDGY
ncbi:MAG: phage holin [Clostridia bacterium]|nr:phage holin [Clostridia bacterium]